MKERPILFTGPMVRTLLAGKKTQTRRIVKPQPRNLAGPNFDGLWSDTIDPVVRYFPCPYGAVGDRLWVKETWKPCFGDGSGASYRADPAHTPPEERGPWKPSIFMTRKRSRITLEITAVRVERLTACTESDAIAEGIQIRGPQWPGYPTWYENYAPEWKHTTGWNVRVDAFISPIESYASLWDVINGAGGLAKNPWVWVIEFRRVEG